jgi:recombinational DNA repair ATPase RecF
MSSTKIKNIHVRNIKAIQEEKLELNGCTAIIIGGNHKGKTTLSRALIDRFRGVKNENIVRVDAKDGMYCMELTSGEKIIWTIDIKGREKITISIDDKKEKVTKEIMQYYFPSGFDVDRFLSETPSKQKKILEKISGLDFTEVDKDYNAAFENRTYYNKRLAEESAKRIKFETHWINEVRSTDDLEKEMNSIDVHNMNYKTVQTKLEEKKKTLVENYNHIEHYKKQIKILEELNMQLETEIDKGTVWLQDEKKLPKDEAYKNQLLANVIDIRANNAAVLQEEEFKKCEKSATEFDNEIKKILADKEEMLRLADMPEGFGFSFEGITYNGFPYDKKNQSSSALCIGALKLATRSIGEVKAVHFDASYLDKNSLLQVQEWAENNNLQLLIERPDFDGGEIRYEIIED